PTSARSNGPPRSNRRYTRAGVLHRSGITHSHAREQSTAQESRNPTRRSSPPLKNHEFPRAGAVHRPGIAQFHARERSTAQELRNSTRGNDQPPKNHIFPRAGSLMSQKTIKMLRTVFNFL